MIHARPDYNRFQEPNELLAMIGRLCSYIKSGEELNEQDLSDVEAIRAKYQTLLGGSNPIAEDEPVMLFRAKDRYFTSALNSYRNMLLNDGLAAPTMAKAVQDHIKKAIEWQDQNGTKIPDMPEGAPK